jgi:hypothetical protein
VLDVLELLDVLDDEVEVLDVLDEDVVLDRPYASRAFRFNTPTGERVTITRQVVAVRASDGALELGLRETIDAGE